MRYSVAAVAAAGVASAAWSQGEGQGWSHGGDSGSWGQSGSWGPPSNSTGEVYVTEVVTAFTTFCPEATVITHGSQTYSASASATITITGPVTITKPVTTSSSAPAVTTSKSTPVGTSAKSSPIAPVPTGSSSKKSPAPSGTAPAKTSPVSPVGTSAGPKPSGSKPSGTAPGGSKPSGTAPGASKSATASGPIATYTGAATQVKAGVVGALAVFGLVAAL